MLACAFNGEALFVQQVLDLKRQFDVLAPVQAVAAAGLLRRQARKLLAPITEHVLFHAHQLGHLADAVVKLIGDLHLLRIRRRFHLHSQLL